MFASDQTVHGLLKVYSRLLNCSYVVSGNTVLPSGAKIIALNHTDGCNPLFLPLILEEKPHFLLQDGLFKMPIIGRLLKETGQIPVYRGTDRAKEAFHKACELLRQGKTIVVFPEGRQVPAGQRIPAKTGTIRMALEMGAPIIPLGLYVPPQNLVNIKIHLQGSQRSGLWQLTGKSYVRFGAAWKPGDWISEVDPPDIHALTDELMNKIYRLVAEIEQEIPCETHALLNLMPQ